jgi:hypothetical protein
MSSLSICSSFFGLVVEPQVRGDFLHTIYFKLKFTTTLLIEMPPLEMHLIGWLPPRVSDRAASDAAARAGIEAAPLSVFAT